MDWLLNRLSFIGEQYSTFYIFSHLLITSYFGHIFSLIMSDLDLRLIPEFSGDSKTSVTEWLAKVELVCRLRGIHELDEVIPLRLTGGAFAVYQQIPEEDKEDVVKIKEALIAAFAPDSFVAYEKFVSRKLLPSETPDVFLAELKRLSALFGGISERGLVCAFISGLPASVRQVLRTGCRIESMRIDDLLVRARAVLADTNAFAVKAQSYAAITSPLPAVADECCGGVGVRYERRCFSCNGANHLAKDCLLKRTGAEKRTDVKCFRCGGPHFRRQCPENAGGEQSAPAYSPTVQK